MDRSSRRINPAELRSHAPPKYAPRDHRDRKSTVSTISGSSRSGNDSSFRSTSHHPEEDARIRKLQKKICPVTGVLREISADYHIFSTVLGKGHYGCVRECEHRRTRQIYAVKSVDKSKIRRLDHLKREVYLLSKMDHTSVMKMVDCYEDVRFVHIVTERCTGGELFDKIADNTSVNGCFSEKKTAGIIKSLLEAVAYLHKNEIVHRDIKPENILFESSQEDAAIKLIDFGLSRRHKAGDPLMNNPVGTAYYMAPELLEGRYDKVCDVWSIGTIVYIMLCGYPPFNGDTDPDIFEAIKNGRFGFPSQVWKKISDEAKNFIMLLMEHDPTSRMTAEEALNHPWIRQQCDAATNGNDGRQQEDLSARIQQLRRTISKLKKSVKQNSNKC